jgi:hypothetical protein
MQSSQYRSEERAQRRTRLAVGLSLLIVLVALAAALSGCSGKVLTYTDKDYGFSFQYNDSWTLRDVPAAELTSTAIKSIEVLDPRGSDAGDGATWDLVAVDVSELLDPTLELTPEVVMADFASYLEQMAAADTTFKVVDQPASITVNSLPALKATYSFTLDGATVRCSEYWLTGPEGLVYTLYTQSTEKNWDGNVAMFNTFLNSFSLGGSESGTTTTVAN